MSLAQVKDSVTRRVKAMLVPLAAAKDEGYIGESISQLAHGLQCAASAEKHGAPDAVVIACLFHDIGHLVAEDAPEMDGLGIINHEGIGGDYLRAYGMPERVAKLVEAHVDAKRYLCHRKPGYLSRLSEASRGTLDWQGGPMSEDEAVAFETDADFKYVLALRSWDEMAKDPNAQVPGLDHYETTIAGLMQTQASSATSEDSHHA